MIHPSTTQSLELQLALYTVKQRPMARGDRVLSTLFQTVGAYGIHQQKSSNVEVTWAPATGRSPSWPAIQQVNHRASQRSSRNRNWLMLKWRLAGGYISEQMLVATSSWSNNFTRATREPKLDESSHRCACQTWMWIPPGSCWCCLTLMCNCFPAFSIHVHSDKVAVLGPRSKHICGLNTFLIHTNRNIRCSKPHSKILQLKHWSVNYQILSFYIPQCDSISCKPLYNYKYKWGTSWR